MFSVNAACGCHMGKVRTNNEDNLYFAGTILPEGNAGLSGTRSLSGALDKAVTVAVFDGMGGEAYGEVASYLAAQTLKEAVEAAPDVDLAEVCRRANGRICAEAARRGVSAMGSTAVILRLSGQKAELVNIGDSRCFLIREETMTQVSVDHTDGEFLAELGLKNRKPSLTQYFGIPPEEMTIDPAAATFDLHPGDRFLLCSDGLTDMLSPQEIYACLSSPRSPREAVDELIALALSHGGKDNTTVIYCRVAPAP